MPFVLYMPRAQGQKHRHNKRIIIIILFCFIKISDAIQYLQRRFIAILIIFESFIHQWIISSGLIHRGSYMSAHVLLNLLDELGKRDKM